MPDRDSFVRRVRGQLDGLSATERRLADFVLAFPGELASYAANELARLAGVSNATVTRFIRRLGYTSYEEARRHVREHRESGSPLFQPSQTQAGITSSAKAGQLLAAHLARSQANLADTFGLLSDPQLREMVKALMAAPQVLIFGTRSSHGFAAYLRWQLMQVLPRVSLVPGPGETLGEYTAGLAARDCLVVFGMRRQTRQLAPFLEAGVNAGARILFISDKASPDFAGATWSVQCHCAGPGPLDNHVAVMAVCDVLASMVFDGTGAAGRKRLAAIEVAHEEHDEF